MIDIRLSTAYLQARIVIGAPSPNDGPMARLHAWTILKAARGQTVNQTRLGAIRRAAALPPPSGPGLGA